MSLLQTGVDYFLVYRFIKALTTPFDKTKAFKLGIIDDEGNFLKKYKELKTRTEKEAYGAYDRMVWNLKKLIEKVPIIGKALTSWAGMAYLLLKEHSGDSEISEMKRTCFLKHVWEDLEILVEVPTNTYSGNIAGVSPSDYDNPPVSKKKQKKYTKKNSSSGKSGKSGRKVRAKL